jgi:hemerythrin-like domain-containing protein
MSTQDIEDLPPTCDLTREHGLLNRLLLIYDHFLETGQTLLAVEEVAKIIRLFIEDYHEQNEEKYIFPLVVSLGYPETTKMVNELIEQHNQGRVLTDQIMDPRSSEQQVEEAVRRFTRMYRAHESREDTEVFELFRKHATPQQTSRIGRYFEESEYDVLGRGGFEALVDKVIRIEKDLGINELTYYE